MSLTRIYQMLPLAAGTTVRLEEKASHHVARVLRARLGDKLILFNGQGGEYVAVITHIDKKGVEVDIAQFEPREAESPVNICLAQGIARGEKMDFIVQKAVELGVNSIIPLVTERCNVRLDPEREEKRTAHWHSVMVSACEQSGRNQLPHITPPMTLTEWLPQASAAFKFVLSPHVQQKFPAEKPPAGTSILLLIGPEGGLSDHEVEVAMQHHFLPLNLGPRVLRTETATIAAITLIQCQFGDMK